MFEKTTKKDSINAIIKIALYHDSIPMLKNMFIENNFNTYIALISQRNNRKINPDKLKHLYSTLSLELKESIHGQLIKKQIDDPKLDFKISK